MEQKFWSSYEDVLKVAVKVAYQVAKSCMRQKFAPNYSRTSKKVVFRVLRTAISAL